MKSVAAASETRTRRGLGWHLKWLFASYAASFGLFLLVFLVSIPFVGGEFSSWWLGATGSYAMLAVALAISPIVCRWLR